MDGFSLTGRAEANIESVEARISAWNDDLLRLHGPQTNGSSEILARVTLSPMGRGRNRRPNLFRQPPPLFDSAYSQQRQARRTCIFRIHLSIGSSRHPLSAAFRCKSCPFEGSGGCYSHFYDSSSARHSRTNLQSFEREFCKSITFIMTSRY